MRSRTQAVLLVAALAGVVAIGVVSGSQHVLTLSIQTMTLAALALSWNILGGYAGQISLGHAAFFGLGALITRELWLGGSSLVLAVAAADLELRRGAAERADIGPRLADARLIGGAAHRVGLLGDPWEDGGHGRRQPARRGPMPELF